MPLFLFTGDARMQSDLECRRKARRSQTEPVGQENL